MRFGIAIFVLYLALALASQVSSAGSAIDTYDSTSETSILNSTEHKGGGGGGGRGGGDIKS